MQWRQWQQQWHHGGGGCGNVGGRGRGSTTAMVQEAATAAAEKVDDGQDGQRLCSGFYFNLILIRFFFSPSPQPSLNAKAMVCSL
jgi:hypothetical protein